MLSDSIDDGIHLLALLDVTGLTQRQIMESGLMVRGAIVCDDLIDNDLIFTGMAMVKAAAMERESKSPFLILENETIEVLKKSIAILYPNKNNRERCLNQTLYDGNKLDCLLHMPFAIMYSTCNDDSKIRKCIDHIIDVSMNNLPVKDRIRQMTCSRVLENICNVDWVEQN